MCLIRNGAISVTALAFPPPMKGRARDAICSSKIIFSSPFLRVWSSLARSAALPPACSRGHNWLVKQDRTRLMEEFCSAKFVGVPRTACNQVNSYAMT